MIEKAAASIAEYLQGIREIRDAWNPLGSERQDLWYRGVSKRSFNLLPGVYRPEAGAYDFDETSLLQTFVMQGMALAKPRPRDDWEWYFLAQHHRVPTRLLDWTENALAALYFAVWSRVDCASVTKVSQLASSVPADQKFDEDSPVVWVLEAGSLNAYSYGLQFDLVLVPGGELTRCYLPENAAGKRLPESFNARGQELTNANPIAIYPYRASDRIVAQQGTFTLHGVNRTPLEELPTNSYGFGPRLACILLDRNRLPHIFEELDVVGVHSLSLFPDLDRVAERARWLYE